MEYFRNASDARCNRKVVSVPRSEVLVTQDRFHYVMREPSGVQRGRDC